MMNQLPIPSFFDAKNVNKFWRVPYLKRVTEAREWKKKYQIVSSIEDKTKIILLLIDVQNTFCLPDFELFVAGKSGNGSVEDNIRLCEFIYRNLGRITTIAPTMDTHTAMQIFHPIFWVDEKGNHPEAGITMISYEEVKQGRWKVNQNIVHNFNISLDKLENYALHYVKKVTEDSKYPLTIWPYHSMLGGIGHALVSAVEEALFFHNMVRSSQTQFELKGDNPLTENYSVLSPEVLRDNQGEKIAQKNNQFLNKILSFDKIIIAGQAKSHCVAWTVEDLLTEIKQKDPNLAKKVYLLEDCTSPVVVPGVIDFTEKADAAFQRFSEAGIHRVNSTDDMDTW
ncbi:putative isochorismatase hydrolase [Crocosphaera subtropica ATCC 51142]|uniref:Isochorismatase hydrolase n=1 Tax=Crocosphaera subtropica (strain ATCC 51142 / BH68) TaxID=43989 RepID=B1WTT7_CROS5|nr:isochorismatase [Crocosphaera subtropica]ACB50403.1 putative isochorismatase hydrolase [Crocosphaera subtropica ATCC 51142]